MRCIKTPSGRAVHITHVGSYETLGESYGRPARWSRDHGLSITGPFWEIHGHWDDDPDLLETERYHLIM